MVEHRGVGGLPAVGGPPHFLSLLLLPAAGLWRDAVVHIGEQDEKGVKYMKRRGFLALALAPLARAIELQAPPRLIYRSQWMKAEFYDFDRHCRRVTQTAEIWVYPREREEHARIYQLGYVLTREQELDYPTIRAQMDLQLARNIRVLERDLLAMPLDWHGELRRRDATARSR